MSSFSSTTACGSRRASYFVYQRRHFLHKMLFTLRFWHTSICCIPQNIKVCHSVLQPFLGMACWWLPKDRFFFFRLVLYREFGFVYHESLGTTHCNSIINQTLYHITITLNFNMVLIVTSRILRMIVSFGLILQ